MVLKLKEGGDLISSLVIALMTQRVFTSLPITGLFICQLYEYSKLIFGHVGQDNDELEDLDNLNTSEENEEVEDITQRVELVSTMTVNLGIIVAILFLETFFATLAFFRSELKNRE